MNLVLRQGDRLLSSEEIEVFVKGYKADIEHAKNGRYSDLIKLVPEGQYGLDYGCGWGAFTIMMTEKGNTMVGQDLDENEVRISKFVWGESDSHRFTSSPISAFEDGSFDFVTSCQVIEHTHNPGMYLHNINRVLKVGGELIISVPNIVNPRYMLPLVSKNLEKNILTHSKQMASDYVKQRDHIQGWEPLHFTRLLASVGFEVVKYMPSEGVPLPSKLAKLKIPLYIFPKSRLRQLSYTMIFKVKKISTSNIGVYD